MRKKAISVEEVKDHINCLIGQQLKVSVNKGRKRIVKYDGEIMEVYPSVFILKILGDKYIDKLSCSYSDVICGDIALKPKEKLIK